MRVHIDDNEKTKNNNYYEGKNMKHKLMDSIVLNDPMLVRVEGMM